MERKIIRVRNWYLTVTRPEGSDVVVVQFHPLRGQRPYHREVWRSSMWEHSVDATLERVCRAITKWFRTQASRSGVLKERA